MKDLMTYKSLFIVLAVLLTFNQAFSEKYIGMNGPQAQKWEAWQVDMGAENIVHWAGLSVTWRLNSNGAGDGLTFDQTKSAVQSSFNAWQDVTTADISFSYGGSTSATWSNDGQNVHYWAESGDPAHDVGNPLEDPGTYAVTVITFNSNEELLDVDIIFDGRDQRWYVNGSEYDIQSVSTHEIGHMIGLHHTEIGTNPKPTMYTYYQGTAWQSLEFDDKVGVSFLYRGNLIDNETFSGTDYYNWNLTVYSAKTLTINPSSTIKFASGKALTINGAVQAQGTAS